MDLKILNNYKAKSDGTTIYQHNEDLKNILKQVKDIYDISNDNYQKLSKIINYHDVGKIHNEFQENTTSTHRKLRHELLSASCKDLDLDEKIAILTHHKDIDTLSNFLENTYYNQFRNEFSQELNIETENVMDLIRDLNKYKKSKELLCNKDTIILKGYLQYCDHVASAGIKEIDIGFNARSSFPFKHNSIQKKVCYMKKRQNVIIQAMTGLGKSATSMYWSDKIQNENKSRRIYYLLPYTASINSLYRDFKSRGISVAMLHSKAEYFLEKEIEDDTNNNVKDKYNTYKKSVKQVTICTIYQLIKAMFGCKYFEMLLAQMKNSIFIIDEVHCFEVKELALILETLKYLNDNYNIDVCIMSASIPTCLLDVIKDKLKINKTIIPDKKDLIIRHRIKYIDEEITDTNTINSIQRELDKGKQVLVCVNSVKTSQLLYELFKNKYKTKLIHGRFNTRDRELIEQDLKTSQLLIGTQAIEVSLDISYDVMFTELAPFDALLQRFGRVNRKGEKGISDIYIFKNTSKIYNEEIIHNTYMVVQDIIEFDKGIIYEDKVNTYLDQVYTCFDIEKYNEIANNYNNVINNLRLGYYNKDWQDDVIGDSTVAMLPICLKDEYENLIHNKQYRQAQSLKVNTYKNKYNCNDYYYNNDLNTYITKYKYDDRGLVIGELD